MSENCPESSMVDWLLNSERRRFSIVSCGFSGFTIIMKLFIIRLTQLVNTCWFSGDRDIFPKQKNQLFKFSVKFFGKIDVFENGILKNYDFYDKFEVN